MAHSISRSGSAPCLLQQSTSAGEKTADEDRQEHAAGPRNRGSMLLGAVPPQPAIAAHLCPQPPSSTALFQNYTELCCPGTRALMEDPVPVQGRMLVLNVGPSVRDLPMATYYERQTLSAMVEAGVRFDPLLGCELASLDLKATCGAGWSTWFGRSVALTQGGDAQHSTPTLPAAKKAALANFIALQGDGQGWPAERSGPLSEWLAPWHGMLRINGILRLAPRELEKYLTRGPALPTPYDPQDNASYYAVCLGSFIETHPLAQRRTMTDEARGMLRSPTDGLKTSTEALARQLMDLVGDAEGPSKAAAIIGSMMMQPLFSDACILSLQAFRMVYDYRKHQAMSQRTKSEVFSDMSSSDDDWFTADRDTMEY